MHDDDGWYGNDGYDGLGPSKFSIWFNRSVPIRLAAAYGVKWVWGQRPSSTIGSEESALDLLKKRYARGEIGKEEFESIKNEIE